MSSSGIQVSVEYSFIAVTPWSTQGRSGNTLELEPRRQIQFNVI